MYLKCNILITFLHLHFHTITVILDLKAQGRKVSQITPCSLPIPAFVFLLYNSQTKKLVLVMYVFIINKSKYGILICAYWMHHLINLMIKNDATWKTDSIVQCLMSSHEHQKQTECSSGELSGDGTLLCWPYLLPFSLYVSAFLSHTHKHTHTHLHL